MKNKGLWSKRLEQNNPREVAFAKLWESENVDCRGINYGYGALQDLFIKHDSKCFTRVNSDCVTRITQRDRFIVATVIQWLGSNCGMGFLHKALDDCGYVIMKKDDLKTWRDK